MRVCLGLVCLNEAPWLRLHLPVMLQATRLDGIVAIDGGSTDGSPDVVRDFGGVVRHRPWQWHFAEQQNAVMDLAREQGYDAMLKWDPDELWFPEHVDQAFDMLDAGYKAIAFPRINFEGDRLHYAPFVNDRDWHDYQTRAFVLTDNRLTWRGRLHAGLNAWELWKEDTNKNPSGPREIIRLMHAPIFHYEGVKPIEERALKWLNYARVKDKQAPVPELPAYHRVPTMPVRFSVEYRGQQPLDPQACGVMAPYKCVRLGGDDTLSKQFPMKTWE